ncbi:MAG: NAD(P)-binding domain-containing protein [Dongiaceae bacterium]
MIDVASLPVAVIGAGPIGLAAAAHLVARGIPVRVYESGRSVGENIRDWSHVRIFTTWTQSVDTASRALLEKHGWRMAQPDALPTGGDLYESYLKPLAETPELVPHIEIGATVTAISRWGIDKVGSKDRAAKPFRLEIAGHGGVREELARAVIDASGTWQNQNPLGASGLPARGEREHRAWMAYGMPDVLGRDRQTYAGRRVVVIGGGYSAINVLLDLAALGEAVPGTVITWVVRGTNLARIYGGGEADELPARGGLGQRLKELVKRKAIMLITGFSAQTVHSTANGVVIDGETSAGSMQIPVADRIVVATGQRPDLQMTRELRLELDPWLESTKALGPLIDPNLHSCGSVPPHGHRETSHPEPGFYTIGVKSYGRAPTFLLLTGYEQARSVAAAIAGDMVAADDVHLDLPETGICQDDAGADGCCGDPVAVARPSCCGADKLEPVGVAVLERGQPA